MIVDQGPKLRADAQRNKDKILETAVRHFSQHGISTSLDDIARDAGVGPGTLYRHFPSREALLLGALEEPQQRLMDISSMATQLSDPDAALKIWMSALQDYLRTFEGLPEPVLVAVEGNGSPLTLTCNAMVEITDRFLAKAQEGGTARLTVNARELFLCALGTAWVSDLAERGGIMPSALNDILIGGYLGPVGGNRKS